VAEHRTGTQMLERVIQAHLDHFCPGGAGVPLTGSGPIGLGPSGPADDDPASDPAGLDANVVRAAGQHCGRCGQPITARQDTRRRIGGTWVHEACPS
jgi:hypothetical protein